MSVLCCTCFSGERTVTPLDNKKFGSLFGERNVLSTTVNMVCWECSALFRKALNFKSQVLLAQQCLLSNIQAPLPPLSKLTTSTTTCNDVCCEEIKSVESKPFTELEIITKNDEDFLNIDIKTENDIDNLDDQIEDSQSNFADFIDDTEKQINEKLGEVKYEDDVIPKSGTRTKRKNRIPKKKVKEKSKSIKFEKGDKLKKCTLQKQNYTIIYMSDEELKTKRQTDKLSKQYRYKCKYKCEDCIVGFLDKDTFNRHMVAKHSEQAGVHQCHICKLRFIQASNHKEHVSSHYRKYRCATCAFTGYDVAAMAAHDVTEHGAKRFVCRVCAKEFLSAGRLKYHRAVSHTPAVACDVCGKLFKAKKYLTVHMQMVHSGTPPAACGVCGARRRHMAAHMLKHNEKPEAAYCAECDMRFSSIPVYKNHLKFAAKHRPPDTLKHECSHCDAKFVNSTALKKHIMVRHRTELRPYKCDKCDKRFEAACRLRVHTLREHEGVEPPKDKICHICGRGFASKFMLSNHIRVHTGEKPFRCELCGAAFSQKSSLTTHTRGVHLKIKPRPARQPTLI